MFALVTVPVALSTITTQIPFPLRLRRFISTVLSGNGAMIAIDFATTTTSELAPNAYGRRFHSRSLPFSRSMFLFGRRGDYFRLFRRRWLFFRRREVLTWWHRSRAPVGLRLFFFHRDGLCWRFFWSRHLLGYRRSVLFRRRCNLLGARFSLFLFRLLDLNHLASLKLIRKIRRSRLLSLAQVGRPAKQTPVHTTRTLIVRTGMAKCPPRPGNVNLLVRHESLG